MSNEELLLHFFEESEIKEDSELLSDYNDLLNMMKSGKIIDNELFFIENKYKIEIAEIDNIRIKVCNSVGKKTHIVNKLNSKEYLECLIDHLAHIMVLRYYKSIGDERIKDLLPTNNLKLIYETLTKVRDSRK